jgi:hypothetical protein
MPFPIDYQTQLRWGAKAIINQHTFMDAFLSAASDELERVKAKEISISGNRISFNVALFRLVSSLNILNPIDKGFIEITPEEDGFLVTYYISFRRKFLLLSLLLGTLLIYLLIMAGPSLRLFGVIGFCWILATFGSYWGTVRRFSNFVRGMLKDAGANVARTI